MTADKLVHECRARGATFRRDGFALVIQHPARLTPALIERIRTHKPAVLAILDIEAVHIAVQVLAGEFTGASTVLMESVLVTLRAGRHPLCVRALQMMAGRTV